MSFDLLYRAAVGSARRRGEKVPTERPLQLTGTLRPQQPVNRSAALVCQLVTTVDWSCHAEWVGPWSRAQLPEEPRGQNTEEDEWITEGSRVVRKRSSIS